ncbi:MAG: hypothetical protein HY280_05540 [Nitrospinae bacterium]|nr:hypothetical protein [Nitrospinota bacterium]
MDACSKCGADLTPVKKELGLDMPRFKSLGIIAYLRKKKAEEEAEKLKAVPDVVVEGVDTEPVVDSDEPKNPHDVDLSDFQEEGNAAHLSVPDETPAGGGELTLGDFERETPESTLPAVVEDGIGDVEAIPDETPQKPSAGLSAVDVGSVEPAIDLPNAPVVADEESHLDIDVGEGIGDADNIVPVTPEKDSLDLEISENPPLEPTPPPARKGLTDSEALNLDGLDLNFDDIKFDLSPGEKKPKAQEKKKEDEGLDIDLSDLKLE